MSITSDLLSLIIMPLVLLVLGAMDLDLEFFTLLADLKSRRDKLILMAGLNGSGKTTILNKIHSEGVSTEIVTPGEPIAPYPLYAYF